MFNLIFFICFFLKEGDINLDKMINLGISQSLGTFNFNFED